MEKISRTDLILRKGGSFISVLTNIFISIISLKFISSFRKRGA